MRVVASVCLLSLAAPAAAGAWSAPQTLSPVTPNGSRAVPGGVLLGGARAPVGLAARGPAGFGAASAWFSPPASERVEAAGVDGAGDATVLTVRAHAPDQRVRAYVRGAAGVVGAAATLSPPGGQATGPVLSVAPDGTAVAAWQLLQGDRFVTQAAVRPAGGRFGPAQTLAPVDGAGTALTAAAGSGGTVAVAWSSGDRDEVVVASARPGSRRLGGTTRIPVAAGGVEAGVALAVAPGGRLAAAVERGSPAQTDLVTGIAGRALGAPRLLLRGADPDDVDSTPPAVAFDGAGEPVVAAVRHVGVFRQLVAFVGRAPGHALSPARATATAVGVAGGPGRSALFTWSQQAGGAFAVGARRTATAALRSRSGAIGRAAALSAATADASDVSGAIAADGTAIAAWEDVPAGPGRGPLLAATSPPGG